MPNYLRKYLNVNNSSGNAEFQIDILHLATRVPGVQAVGVSHSAVLVHFMENYLQISNISRTLVGNDIVAHSDVVGAMPVGATTTLSFSWLDKDNCNTRRETFKFWDLY